MRDEASENGTEPGPVRSAEGTTETTSNSGERTDWSNPERVTSGSEANSDEQEHESDSDSGSNQAGATRRQWLRHLRLPSARRGRALVAAGLGLALALTAGAGIWVRATSLPEGAAFAYGDRVVMQDELDSRTQALRALYGVEPPRDPGQRNAFRRDVAKSMAVGMLLEHAAADRKIVVAEKQARDALDRYVTAQFGEGGRDAFVRSLGNVGTSERVVLDEIKRQFMVGRLMDQVVGQVSISDSELRSEFDKRQPQLGAPERRVVRNVVLGSEQEAHSVLDQVRAGTPIEEIAVQRSRDASTKQSGGMLGELRRDQLERPVGDAAFAAPQGGTFGPVKGQFGWNVGRVDRVLPPAPAEFDKVHDSLRKRLHSEESLKRWRGWLGEQIRAADVEYAPDYRPADPDAPPVANNPGGGPAGGSSGAPPR